MQEGIGLQLARARKAAGLKQADLAAALALHPSTVSEIETGAQNPSVDVVQRWARLCGSEVAIVPEEPDVSPSPVTIVPTSIGARFAAIRRARGISAADVAQRSGYTRTLLSQFENDRATLTIVQLERLAGALGLRVRIEFGEQTPTEDDVPARVAAAWPALSPVQREVLRTTLEAVQRLGQVDGERR